MVNEKTKRKIAYRVGTAGLGIFYAVFVYVFVFISLHNSTIHDRGTILEIVGFVIYLDPIRGRLARWLFSIYPEGNKEKTILDVISIVGILTVIIGLYTQLNNPPWLLFH